MIDADVYFEYDGDFDLEAKATYRLNDGRFTAILINLTTRGEREVNIFDWKRGISYCEQMSNSDIRPYLIFLGVNLDVATKWYMPENMSYADEVRYEPSEKTVRCPYVYFIYNRDEETIKIGKSVYPGSRLQELQRMTKSKLELLKCIKGGRQEEKEHHERFSDFRIHGEWFTYDGLLREYVESLPNDPDE